MVCEYIWQLDWAFMQWFLRIFVIVKKSMSLPNLLHELQLFYTKCQVEKKLDYLVGRLACTRNFRYIKHNRVFHLQMKFKTRLWNQNLDVLITTKSNRRVILYTFYFFYLVFSFFLTSIFNKETFGRFVYRYRDLVNWERKRWFNCDTQAISLRMFAELISVS